MIELMRSALREPFKSARKAHPGLLLQRGYAKHESGDAATKAAHVERLCEIPASDLYHSAYQRWVRFTANGHRFAGAVLRLDTRLFIGLSAGGMLETGCAIQHSYGVPYIPGSSIKGVVSSYARKRGLSTEACEELFGAEARVGSEHPDGLSGVIGFHDAWWVPGSARTPLVQEVVTTHHLAYYGSEGSAQATDFDSPVPNAQVAVRGSFLFLIEGPSAAWLDLALKILKEALNRQGIGAKTRAGYGYFSEDPERDGLYRKALREFLRDAEVERERHLRELAAEQDLIAFEKLSEEGKQVHQTVAELNRYTALSEAEQRAQRSQLIAVLNSLSDSASAWPPEDRSQAAALLERAYDSIGWFDPGKDKKQRQKQEDKRRAAIAALRG
jgi:CRISPR-associated protein Cmr6